ncbi:PREDICTED: uncharacterized protein LOC109162331 [Ipomoea nil]|uniref:uncharacterized protein LOC109162331 n=1 Tax=Ipomoea nil TaxID=35883 RepID=UPI000901E68A|nr:PREDICTED: uncharacterized protein LOC109162331 [Ipomoea nil]
METKVGRVHAERIRVTLGFDGMFYVDISGLSGGLALLWRRNNTASLLSFSKTHIDIEVTIPGFPNWRMTCYYGFPERNRRNESWELLRSLASRSDLPWVVMGDFNDLLYQHEKRGGNPHLSSLLRGFGDTIEDCVLSQMPMEGYQFTWEKGQGTPNWIEEKFDKVLTPNDWRNVVVGARVTNLATRRSDHSALFLGIHDSVGRGGTGKRGFQFEMAWLHDEGCRGVVEESWEEGRSMGLQDCIQYCGDQLSRWGGDRHHKFGNQINTLRKEQQRLHGHTDPTSLAKFQHLEELMSRLEAQEDAYWRQRAKQHWLRNADANTKFYHSHRENGIVSLLGFPHESLRHIMNVCFAPLSWMSWGDISNFVINCLQSPHFPEGLNDTDMVMIPKIGTPQMVTDLRPIALSNVVYRVMAKMITNRMKPLMEEIISDSQSAFIPDRLIIDNILLATEVGHFLNRKQCGVVGWSALKLDMAKAYDRMEWSFLRGMLLALGFDSRWVELIMLCVVNYHNSSICYSKNTGEMDRMEVAQILGVVQAPNFGKYLGLPSFVGRNKKAPFSYIEDKIRQRIGSWTFERIMNCYWWGSGTDHGIHWKVGNNPCFCWRSIMAAKGLICSGVRRRIGNGETTLIWDHPWIQDDQEPRYRLRCLCSWQEPKL